MVTSGRPVCRNAVAGALKIVNNPSDCPHIAWRIGRRRDHHHARQPGLEDDQHAIGQLESSTDPNDHATTFAYDSQGRIVGDANAEVDGRFIEQGLGGDDAHVCYTTGETTLMQLCSVAFFGVRPVASYTRNHNNSKVIVPVCWQLVVAAFGPQAS